jgi:hypothetical protein
MREDSADGQVWQYFPYENARSRAYRWNEDALVSLCDRAQRLCFALAFWNGRDPFLKEGIFGLLNSLIPAKNSLFFEIFSLLICVGNCAKSDCGAAVSCYEIGPGGPEIAKFPVKFPVNREFWADPTSRDGYRKRVSTQASRTLLSVLRCRKELRYKATFGRHGSHPRHSPGHLPGLRYF